VGTLRRVGTHVDRQRLRRERDEVRDKGVVAGREAEPEAGGRAVDRAVASEAPARSATGSGKSLHDRPIITADATAWVVWQSFKDLA